MLDLCSTSPPEVCSVAVLGEAQRVPETRRRLHSQFVLKGPQRGVDIGGPVTPGAAGQPILIEHADDGHHGQATIGQFCIQPPCLYGWVASCEQGRLPTKVRAHLVETTGDFTIEAVSYDLKDPTRRNLRE